MKTYIIALVSFLFTLINVVQASNLEFRSLNNQSYLVNLNGQSFQMNQGILSLVNIPAGNYAIEISPIFPPNYSGPKPFYLIYSGNIIVAPNTRAHYLVQHNNLILSHLSNMPIHIDNCPPQVYYPGNYPNYAPPQAPYYPLGPQAMDDNSFNQLLRSINNQSFSSGKMSIYKQALSSNYFTTNQVVQLINTFTFSSDKLEVAKSAYTSTIDNQNYFMVNDAFDYTSQVRALNDYIASLE